MADVKKITPDKPVEVRVESNGKVYFVTVFKNGSLEIRPKGVRRPESTALTTVSSVYTRAIMKAAEDAKPKRKRLVKRGMLSL